jgi:signal transduction histidine kinase
VLLDTLGLAGALEWHLHQFQKCTGIPSELTVNDAGGIALPEEYAAAIFEIYGEGLKSAAGEAAVSAVTVNLTLTSTEVRLLVASRAGADNERITASVRLQHAA